MARLSEGVLLDLIERAYQAALDPVQWPNFLDGLAEALQSRAALFSQDERTADASIAAFVRFDPTFIQSYAEHYGAINVWRPWWQHAPAGRLFNSRQMVETETLERSEWYGDWLLPQGLYDASGVTVLKNGTVTTAVTLIRAKDPGPFTPAEMAFWAKLLPHLQRAIQVHRELCSVRLQRDGALAALDGLAVAIIIASAEGQVLFCNSVADRVLKAGRGLLTKSGRLGGETPDVTNRLQRTIRQAACTGAGEGRHAGSVLSLPCHSGEPLSVLVSPMRAESVAFQLPGPSALLFFSDPQQPRNVAQDDLTRVFGLSPAESRLASALLAGTRLSDYAEAAGISLNTAKAQLKQVFAKTGVNRQSDLMRRVADDLALRVARQN